MAAGMSAHGILSCAQAEAARKKLAAELERVTAALREAEEAMTEAWEYLAHDEGDAAAVVLEAALAGGARAAQDENA
jgi:hypothetical protein